MKICWFGIYKGDYSRNKVLISGLRNAGIEIVECNIESKGIIKYFKLIKSILSLNNNYDILFCAFPINYYVIIGKLFQRKPIVVDAFFPLHDAYVNDRKSQPRISVKSLVYYLVDRLNLHLADLIITDTEQHKKYWLDLKPDANIEVIRVGADTKEFFPIITTPKSGNKFIVTFHGSYIPLQGIDKIVQAAEILKDEKDIKFRFIGNGQLFEEINSQINRKELDIEIIPWLSIEELNLKLNEADIVLGIFGDSAKTNRVIPNKVFQGIAVKKPVMTMDTDAVREVFSADELYLVRNSPEDIANAILDLHKDSDKAALYANNAYKKFTNELTEDSIGQILENVLIEKFGGCVSHH